MIPTWMRGIFARFTSEPRHPDQRRVSGGRTIARVNVTPDTALKVAAVWACIRYLSQTVAVLPWHVMRETAGGAEIQYAHPIDWKLWKRPSEEWSSFQFRETLTHWALRWGNGYAEIERDQIDRPYALHPIHPERMDVCRAMEPIAASNGAIIRPGELAYEVSNGTGEKTTLAAKDVFHIRGFGEGPVGVSVIQYAAESIGWAAAAQLFGASFFGNGTNISGVVVNKSGLTPEGLRLQKEEFEQKLTGPRNAHKIYHLGGDGDFKRISLDAEETQLIPVHQHLVEEICRWFGVPPHKVMHLLRATFSNIEHQAIEVVVDSVSPWVKRFEDEADHKLFGQNRQGLYTKMNMRALLRGDFKSQNEGLQIARNAGVISADEWRELLDLNRIGPAAGGDKYITQSNQTTLEKIGAEPEPAPTPIAPEVDPEDEDEDAPEDAVEALARARSLLNAMPEPAHVG